MQPKIEIFAPKTLVGINIPMSMALNKTGELWKAFMPRLKEIKNIATNDLYSLQIYPPGYFIHFNPANVFVKWALVEVDNFDDLPHGMETFNLGGGQYAIFDYKGSSNDPKIFQYIFSNWLPQSGYQLDHRPHFEILGEKYKNNDPNSEEEICIPIKS